MPVRFCSLGKVEDLLRFGGWTVGMRHPSFLHSPIGFGGCMYVIKIHTRDFRGSGFFLLLMNGDEMMTDP